MKKIFELEIKGVKVEVDEEVLHLNSLKYGLDLKISVEPIKRLCVKTLRLITD